DVACPFSSFGTLSSASIDVIDLQNCLNMGDVFINAAATSAAGTGSITVDADVTWGTTSRLTLQANSSSGDFIQMNAQILPTVNAGGTFCVINGGDLFIGDGTQTVNCGIDAVSGGLSINVRKLEMYGGTSATSDALISTGTGGLLTVTTTDHIILQGGTGDNSSAFIQRTVDDPSTGLYVTGGADLNLTGGSGINSSAKIINQYSGAFVIAIPGDFTFQGGSGSTDASVGFFTGLASGGTLSDLDFSGRNLSLIGGSGTGDCSAQVSRNSANSGQLHISMSGTITLTGGTSSTADAVIFSNFQPFSSIQSAGDLKLSGSTSATGSGATINIPISSLDIGGNILLEGGGLLQLWLR
ncbi:MAG: hypothetical protein HYZ48_01955, partial [Chlamydiales bacterium]|nr:hypothetical protein [Chlamydiales bacterium]